MRLISLRLDGRYKGLGPQTFNFSRASGGVTALIGLNGSGKSQLLELIAEVFAYLERWNRPDFQTRRTLPFAVSLHYTMCSQPDGAESTFRVSIDAVGDVKAFKRDENGEWVASDDEIQAPKHIVGYASGLNENLQRSFMKNAVQFNEVIKQRMRRRGELAAVSSVGEIAAINQRYLKRYSHIFKSRPSVVDWADYFYPEHEIEEADTPSPALVYLDYDNFGLLLLALSMVGTEDRQKVFKETAYRSVSRVKLSYNLRDISFAEDSVKDIKMLVDIAGEGGVSPDGPRTSDAQYDQYDLDYFAATITLDLRRPDVREELLARNSGSAISLFNRLSKIQLLGAKHWAASGRRNLMKDDFLGTVKKPLKSKLPLSVADLFLTTASGNEVSFDDISDGEAQLIQILAAVQVFSGEESLFLLDEPETHLNPSWRTYFHQRLCDAMGDDVADGGAQVFVSTHSPFMISSLPSENVCMFRRSENDGEVTMEPIGSQTYGASFDVLVKEHFGLKSLISQTVVEEVKRQLAREDLSNDDKLAWVEATVGESMEKAYLLRKLRK